MEKKRVVIKIGSSSLQHPETGKIDFLKMERLVRELCDLRNRGLDVCLVSSGAIAAGRMFMGIKELPMHIAKKQACARGAGKADDDVSEAVCRISSDGGTGSDDKKYNARSCVAEKCAEYI